MSFLIALLLALVPSCPTEDSSNCYWDGGSNHQGQTFIDIGGKVLFL